MDNPEELKFLNSVVAMRFNPLQEGEYIACQTFPPPKQTWRGTHLSVSDLVYRGFDYKEARKAADTEDMGRDCSIAGVCQVINGQLKKLAYDGFPYENLDDSSYWED